MSSPTPYQRFQKSYDHAVSLLPQSSSFKAYSREADLTRYAIVLGVASMDAYFTKKFLEKLTQFLKKKEINDCIKELLQNSKIDEKVYLGLLQKERPYRIINNKVQKYLERLTTQKFDKIDNLFKKYKIHDLCDKSISYAKKNLHDIKHNNYKRRIAWLVNKRNAIAHTCDLNSHNRFNAIDSKQVKEYLKSMEIFVAAAEHILNSELS